MKISINDIKVSKRLRELDNSKVGDLVTSIKEIGLLQPIVIDTENNLLAGNHRLQACKYLGFDQIECKQISVPEKKKRLIEIDENLVHKDLSVLERAEHILLKEKILKELGVRATKKGVFKYTKITTEQLAEQIGTSKRMYQRVKQVAKINEKARKILQQTEVGNNLQALIQIQQLNDDDLQIEVAKRIERGYAGKVKGLVANTELITPSPFGRGGGRKWRNRNNDDFYPTTNPAITKMLLQHEQFEGSIYEPACGEGHISKVLIDAGHDVFSTDLVDRGYGTGGVDFLNDEHIKKYYNAFDNVITNPPFKYGKEFVKQAKKVATRKIAIFHTTTFLSGVQRYEMWQDREFALRKLIQFSGRVSFKASGILGQDVPAGGWISWAWYLFQKGYTGKPTIEWILPEANNCED